MGVRLLNLEFFDKLYADKSFCEGIGKMVLTAGKLESVLRVYLSTQGIDVPEKRATLGALTEKLKERNLLSKNGEMHFEDLKTKRNYLAHKLYDLFSDRIEETILPRNDLVDLDVEMFAEKASSLAYDLDQFALIVQREIIKHNKQIHSDEDKPSYLI
jgi:hypothetical protein